MHDREGLHSITVSPSTARLEAIHISRGGVPKLGVFEALIAHDGLDGDFQNDTRHHGGPDRAVVLYSLDLIRALQAEGHPIAPGTTGENLTLSGLHWESLTPGTTLLVGAVELRLTKYADPCRNISHSFLASDFMRISQNTRPGWSRVCARVLTGGLVRPGDPVLVKPDEAD